MEKDIQKRQTAYLCGIKEITTGTFLKEESFEPSYITTITGRKISRINLLGVLVSKRNTDFYESILLDDGTDRISVRAFEKKGMFDSFSLGTILLIIGRVREYQNERYIAAEIVKAVENPRWVELRKAELELIQKLRRNEPVQEVEEPKKKFVENEKNQEIDIGEEAIIEEDKGPVQKMYELIKELDTGQGADYEEVIKQSKIEQGEMIIQKLIKNGDIFEIKPGKLKVLS